MIAIIRKVLGSFSLCLALAISPLAAEPVTPDLTDKLRRLLQEEMRSIQGAMTSIHSAMVMGQHEAVAQSAQQIHDSFILKQSLTEQDRKDLVSAVPEGFIELDKEFHRLAASLAEAGRNRNTNEQHRIFGEMTGNCLECHSEYVSKRFPDVNYDKEQ
ncbi:Cytochrome C' [Marinobacter daqiaonensis]|uniref:Cytochrome C n=2 Tax=Marinobacter daqiaonensis TaxID=650891 RepID=A0A1I6GJD8_9GAMM|nr:cytochrome c [Marinobacter daqiaonensis]SFR42187.1 Cytochrome C' [Marinobacter daqiaonensis]